MFKRKVFLGPWRNRLSLTFSLGLFFGNEMDLLELNSNQKSQTISTPKNVSRLDILKNKIESVHQKICNCENLGLNPVPLLRKHQELVNEKISIEKELHHGN